MIAARPFKGMGLGVKGISPIVRYFSKLGVDYITDQGEEHQRAWEAELLASSETMTLVDAATEGPTAAKDAAKEHERPALAMLLGGAIMHGYAFVALTSYRYPMTTRVDLGFKVELKRGI